MILVAREETACRKGLDSKKRESGSMTYCKEDKTNELIELTFQGALHFAEVLYFFLVTKNDS